jgi:uncharacterized protein YdeI (BOF family)
MKKLACLLVALSAVSPLSAPAAPNPYYHTTSVAWIVRTRNDIGVDDNYVTMIGTVTRRIGNEEYWFTDGTGSVRLDSENFDLPIGRRVVIGGRIDQAYLGFGHLEVDVRRWRYAAPYHPRVARATTTVTRTVQTAPAVPAAPPVTAPAAAPAQTAPPLAPPPGQ